MTACLLRVLLATVLLAVAGTAGARDVALGVFAWQGESGAEADWAPVARYLNAALPAHRFRLDHYDAAGLRQAIADGRIDLVVTNPGHYISLEAEYGLSRIATRVAAGIDSPARAIGSAVIVRSDARELTALESLRGRRLAAVAPDAFGGYLAAARELKRHGVDTRRDLRELRFVGLPMIGVIEAVRRGEADAGVVRGCFVEQLLAQERLDPHEFRILSPRREAGYPCAVSTELYPDWPIAVTRGTDPVLAKDVARALLAMPASAEHVAWTVPADYRPVHELYQELQVGPYAHLRELGFESVLRRLAPWIGGVLLLLVAWLVHTLRVEHQVRRRTAELRDSMEARRLAEERVEHLSRLSILGELSGSLAHELNQPLTTISTYARSVLRRQAAQNLSAQALVEACTDIANEAERAGGIVQRIRHFARKRTSVRERVDLVALAREAQRLVGGMLADAPAIDVHPPAVPCGEVLADAQQVQQVLLNLLKNAVDALRGLPAERRRIDVVVEPAEDHRAVVHVIDRGDAPDEAQLQRLFEPFFTTKPDGLGLGLPICKTIVEAHGGRLTARRNADGPGMCFSFSLPCHEPGS